MWPQERGTQREAHRERENEKMKEIKRCIFSSSKERNREKEKLKGERKIEKGEIGKENEIEKEEREEG